MILKVNKDICEIKQNEVWNVGDYNVHTVEVELSDEFDGLVNKVRYFTENNCYDMLITNNIAGVPYEATLTEGTIKIGVYGYDADTDILVQSTSPVNKYISSGTYTGEANNTQPLTPTDKQQMESAIQKNTNDITDLQNNKQNVLISGENIKTINNESVLGEGNIEIDLGTINYDDVQNKPSINNVELYGSMSLSDLGIQPEGNYATIDDLTEESRVILNEVATSYYNKTQTNNLLNNKQNTLVSGQNIKTINNESILGEGNITIQGGGSSDYEDLENLPKINSVELKGNKSLSDLGIQPTGDYALKNEIPDVSNFITKDVNNLTYYTLSSSLASVATSGSYSDLSNKPDLSTYATVSNLNNEISARENADTSLQNQIDAITSSSDVIDIVGTYQDLQNYDTSHVKANDIIKVLQDNTHNNAMSYYRWVITNNVGAWVYVGSEAPYYTKGETDTLLNNKQNVISSSNKLSAELISGLATVATSGSYNDLSNKPTIPSEVTETTVSNWGFTKNAGTITGITMNGTSKGTSGVVDLGTVITSHQDISGKLDTSKVKSAYSTTSGDVYDVTYINSTVGDIESLLAEV